MSYDWLIDREALLGRNSDVPLSSGDAADMVRVINSLNDKLHDLKTASKFLLWQYDREGPLSESTEAWEQLRAALGQ